MEMSLLIRILLSNLPFSFPTPNSSLPKQDNTTASGRRVYQRMSMIANECREVIAQRQKVKTKNEDLLLKLGSLADEESSQGVASQKAATRNTS
jgi:hypothetical protein